MRVVQQEAPGLRIVHSRLLCCAPPRPRLISSSSQPARASRRSRPAETLSHWPETSGRETAMMHSCGPRDPRPTIAGHAWPCLGHALAFPPHCLTEPRHQLEQLGLPLRTPGLSRQKLNKGCMENLSARSQSFFKKQILFFGSLHRFQNVISLRPAYA